MKPRKINFTLQVTAAVLAAAAAATVVVGLMLPIENQSAAQAVASKLPAPGTLMQLPAEESFSPLFGRSFQTPLGAGAAQAAGVPAADAPADPNSASLTQLVLVGTIGSSLALIKGPDGTTAMLEPGDDVNGAPVLAVRPSEVDLRFNGKITTLRMPAPPDDGVVIPAK